MTEFLIQLAEQFLSVYKWTFFIFLICWLYSHIEKVNGEWEFKTQLNLSGLIAITMWIVSLNY